MYSPWFIPFQVICAAVLFCGNTVTPTEHRMIEDLRKHWSPMMQRVSYDHVAITPRGVNVLSGRYGRNPCIAWKPIRGA